MGKSKNKSFVINNGSLLRKYALDNYAMFGEGIIVVNLLLLKTDILDSSDLNSFKQKSDRDSTINYPVSYVPHTSFWFKMLSLKIKEKYKIEIDAIDNCNGKFFIIFIKDIIMENFSIYALNT
jgi:hypothetical protein